MENKIISGLMLTLVAGLVLAPLARATNLSEFPGFLAKVEDGVSTPNYYIVVGDNAAPIDVVGAIDVASTLASALSYQEKSVPGVTTTEVEGKELEYSLDESSVQYGLTKTHVPLLWRGDISFRGDTYYSYEKVYVTAEASNSLSDDLVNGSAKGIVSNITYDFILSEPIDNSTDPITIENPLKLNIFGKEYQIIGFDSSSITILSGVTGMADSTTPVEYEGYKFYVVDGETGEWAKIQVTDEEGNVVASDIYELGKSPLEFNLGGKTIKVKVLSVYASAITSTITAKLAVGEEVEKKIPVGTGDDSVFPEEPWVLSAVHTSGSAPNMLFKGLAITYDFSRDSFEDSDTSIYLGVEEKVVAPNGYFEVGVEGFKVNDFATVTVEPVEKLDVYDEDNPETMVGEDLYGLKLVSDIPVFGASQEYSEYYVLYNDTHYVEAYKIGDTVVTTSSKIVAFNSTGWSGPSEGEVTRVLQVTGKFDATSFDVSVTFNATNVSATTETDKVSNVGVKKVEVVVGSDRITLNFHGLTSAAPYLGATKDEAEASDVVYGQGIGKGYTDVITDYGVVLKNLETNAENDKVVMEIPADEQKLVLYVGKIGGTTTTGGTYKEAVAITSPVAKLASEVDTAVLDKDLILVGGPCANPLVQQLVDAGKLNETYTCAGGVPGEAWTPNTAYIIVVDDAFNGHRAMIVAGTMGTDTRVACSALQNYDTYLSGIESNAVKIDTTVAASPVVTAL